MAPVTEDEGLREATLREATLREATLREATLRAHLLGDRPQLLPGYPLRLRILGWLGPLLVTAVGAFLRFWHLDRPHKLVFDETYYVKEGWSLIRFGTEMQVRQGLDKVDDLWNAGTTDIHNSTSGNIVVHPPIGKWVIGLGEWLLGPTSSVGWRLGVAVLGSLSILILGRIALRLVGSVLLACLASLLVAFEGLHFTMSRTAILDMVVMFFALVAFACLLLDRDRTRGLLAARMALDPGRGRVGPWLGWRPWRWAAGLSLALCTSTKWSGLVFVAVFGVMTLWWDLGARRAVGARGWLRSGLLLDGPYAAVQLVLVTAVVYPLTWLGWFRSSNGYLRHWAEQHPGEGVLWLPSALRSFVHYHHDMWTFNTTLAKPHSYMSNAWGWMVQARPTSFFYESPKLGQQGCTVESCSQAVTTIGTLPFWWFGLACLFVIAWHWLIRRDWRAGAIAAGIIAGYAPWLYWQNRTIFAFYAVAFEPFVALAIVFTLALILRPALLPGASALERAWRIGVVTGYVCLCLAVFGFFYPIHAAEVIPYAQWWLRMWFPSWV